MTDTRNKRPAAARALLVLMIVLGAAAVVSGAMLFASPDGGLMKMSTDMLEGSPFKNYLIPGIILFVFVGIFPLMVAAGLLNTRLQFFKSVNPLRAYHWSLAGALAAGLILLIWIVTETALLGYVSFLQPVMAAWGLLLLALAGLRSVRRYYAVR